MRTTEEELAKQREWLANLGQETFLMLATFVEEADNSEDKGASLVLADWLDEHNCPLTWGLKDEPLAIHLRTIQHVPGQCVDMQYLIRNVQCEMHKRKLTLGES